MIEEPEQPFPTSDDCDPNVIKEEDEEEYEDEEEPEPEKPEIKSPPEKETVDYEEGEKSSVESRGADSAVHISSSTGSEGDTTGPSTAENSVSHAPPSEDVSEPKQVVGGRASIPDELEPHQLACLQNLKESNA